jgi:hypothetical protein
MNINFNCESKSLELMLNPRNYYDAGILAFKCLPPKSVAVAAAALTSSVALYMLKPETLLFTVGVVGASSAISWVTAETAHYFASKAFDKKISELTETKLTQKEQIEIDDLLNDLLRS